MDRMEEPLFTHANNEEFLRMLRERKAKLGIEEAKIEIRFEDLTVEAQVREGQTALPTLINAVRNAMQELLRNLHLSRRKKQSTKILDGVKGIIRPSRMTLILGPPGSGKSTFLRALSRKLDPTFKLTGKVLYNGQELGLSDGQHMAAYVSQHDQHHAEMTVRETLDFSGRMFGTNNVFKMLSDKIEETRENNNDQEIDVFLKATCGEGNNLTTNYFLKLLGLYECANIIIGDEMRRGISGGQKKRVTIGEMLVSLARSFFMDDISTGLDSSTTFEIVKFLRQIAELMDLTVVISLLQPPPETFELFDDIILLCEGKIIYQGPCDKVLEFFEQIGFKCPKRKNTADFLQEVISKMDQSQYWASKKEYQYLSVEKLAAFFPTSRVGQLLEEELHRPYNITDGETSIQLSGSKRISKWDVFKACFSREILLFKRNSPVHIFKTIQIALLAIVVMTLFLRTEMKHQSIEDGNKFMGAIFAGVVIVKFNGMTELQMTIKRIPIFYKQRELLLLPGWALLSSVVILSLPSSLIETGIWTCLTYFVIGYAPSAIRFFQQFLALFCVHQMSMGLFRFISVVGRTQVMANTLGTATLIAIYILGGFVISKDNIQPWLAWGYWASPLTYGQNAVALNEFLDERWSMEILYEHIKANTIGQAVLRSRGLLTEWHWYWICIGALLGYSVIFNVLSIFALEYLNPIRNHQVNKETVSKDIKGTSKVDKQIEEGTAPKCELIILPFQPLTLVFQHINYYVDMPSAMKKGGTHKKRLQLLQDVSGAFKPGVLTALMGVTGAGKTTLLDVLAGRKTGGYMEGTIMISGYPKRQETFARVSGYCEQTDIHSPFVTVYESLQYSAWLRLSSSIKTGQRNMFVEEVMGLVELLPLRNAIVGLPGVGLSAEQRKRLTIAVELVSSPSIIFMDEPTSGLDARAAAIVMRTVRKTVDTGRTVVCTIHQPSIEIFEAFDELLLMKRGGQLIYSGSLGPLSCNMIQYFEAIPRCPKIKKGQNPAAWMLDISVPATEYNICVDYADIFSKASLYRENMKILDELSQAHPDSEDLHFPTKFEQDFELQCIACLWKQHKSYWKNPEQNVVRFITTLIVSLVFGMVFWQIGSKITTEQDIFNILGAMYGSALFLGFTNTNMIQPVVAMERTVFYREQYAGMYSSMAYAIAQVAIEIPYITVQVLIFSVTVYPMIGFQLTVVKCFWFLLFMLLNFTYFTLYGMMTIALTPTQDIAAGLPFLIFILWNVFSGFIIPRKMIPVWWRWFYWVNPAAWTVYGLMFSQLGDRVEPIHVPGQSDQTVKEFLEDYLGLQDHYFALIVVLHFAIIILFTIVFGYSIKHFNFQKR